MSKSGRSKPICPYCQKASTHGLTHTFCTQKYCIDGLISVWRYEGIIKKGILSLKYKYATEVGKELTGHLTNWLQNNKRVFPEVSCLTPVPLYWQKENVRGFNQSEEIGKSVATAMDWNFIPNLLIKKQSTISQVELGGEDRNKNLKGVFAANPNFSVSYFDSILIFDDVYTTGSTLKELAMVLKKAGVKKVWGLTIAR